MSDQVYERLYGTVVDTIKETNGTYLIVTRQHRDNEHLRFQLGYETNIHLIFGIHKVNINTPQRRTIVFIHNSNESNHLRGQLDADGISHIWTPQI